MDKSNVGIVIYKRDYDKILSDIKNFNFELEEIEKLKDFIINQPERIYVGSFENRKPFIKFIILKYENISWNEAEFPYSVLREIIKKNGEFLKIGEEISDIVHEGYGDFEDKEFLGISREILISSPYQLEFRTN